MTVRQLAYLPAPHLPASILQLCQKQVYPLTVQKQHILQQALEMKAGTTLDELLARLQHSGMHVSRSSVYEVLQWLVRQQVLTRATLRYRHVVYQVNWAYLQQR